MIVTQGLQMKKRAARRRSRLGVCRSGYCCHDRPDSQYDPLSSGQTYPVCADRDHCPSDVIGCPWNKGSKLCEVLAAQHISRILNILNFVIMDD